MLSANNETKTVMKGINHGACDYLVKPVRLEQLRGIWTHVVRNSKTNPRIDISSGSDDSDQKLQSEDGDKDEQDGENHTSNYSKKNKKDVGGADEDKENRSTKKRQRVQWSGDLHRKFVQAANQIGMDSKFSQFVASLSTLSLILMLNCFSYDITQLLLL